MTSTWEPGNPSAWITSRRMGSILRGVQNSLGRRTETREEGYGSCTRKPLAALHFDGTRLWMASESVCLVCVLGCFLYLQVPSRRVQPKVKEVLPAAKYGLCRLEDGRALDVDSKVPPRVLSGPDTALSERLTCQASGME
jgi:hypothetical protein